MQYTADNTLDQKTKSSSAAKTDSDVRLRNCTVNSSQGRGSLASLTASLQPYAGLPIALHSARTKLFPN